MISIADDGWNSNILLRIMIAMNNQENTCTKELMEKLYELFKEVYGQTQWSEQAITEYQQNYFKGNI